MKGDITLHPTLGVNAHMTSCVVCGGDSNSIALLGANAYKAKCTRCGVQNWAVRAGSKKCGSCKHNTLESTVLIQQWEKVPSGRCEGCESEMKRFRECVASIYADGKYPTFCNVCGALGAVPAESVDLVAMKQESPDSFKALEARTMLLDMSGPNCHVCTGEYTAHLTDPDGHVGEAA